MPIIKPLEIKPNQTSLLKLVFLIALVATGVLMEKIFINKKKDVPSVLGKTQEKLIEKAPENNLVNNSIKKVEQSGGEVLGEVTRTVNKLASDAGSFVSTVIYENSIGKVVDQIDKLPKDQQEKIKEQICH